MVGVRVLERDNADSPRDPITAAMRTAFLWTGAMAEIDEWGGSDHCRVLLEVGETTPA